MTDDQISQVERIKSGLESILLGEDKAITIVAALSIAITSAHMVGMPRLDLQKMLMRMYGTREPGGGASMSTDLQTTGPGALAERQ